MRKQLTAQMVERIAPPPAGKRLEIFDTIVPALGLRVTENGAKSFVLRGRVLGSRQCLRLWVGDPRAMKLADARQAASDLLRQMRVGQDPRDAKRAARRQPERTVASVVEAFIAEHVSKLRSRDHTERVIRRYIVPAWGRRPISSITTEDVSELVRGIADKPQMAALVLSHLKGLFRWAAAPGRGYVKVNPTSGLSARHDFDITRAPRQVKLLPEHLRLLWTLSPELGYPWTPFFRMLLLSGQRRGEVAGMRWDEIDEREQVWIVPAERMKAGRDHEVPLSPAMVELLA